MVNHYILPNSGLHVSYAKCSWFIGTALEIAQVFLPFITFKYLFSHREKLLQETFWMNYVRAFANFYLKSKKKNEKQTSKMKKKTREREGENFWNEEKICRSKQIMEKSCFIPIGSNRI